VPWAARVDHRTIRSNPASGPRTRNIEGVRTFVRVSSRGTQPFAATMIALSASTRRIFVTDVTSRERAAD
jgi:hypothetical protein